jgi:hypothetical protein
MRRITHPAAIHVNGPVEVHADGQLVLGALPGRPFRAENGSWLPADAVAPWSLQAVI